MDDKSIRKLRRFGTVTFLKIILSLGLVFVLFRIVIPDFVNAHDDLLGLIGVACMIAVPIIIGWLAVSIFLGVRHFIEQGNKQ